MLRNKIKASGVAGVFSVSVFLSCAAPPSGGGGGNDSTDGGPPSPAVPAKSLSYDLIAIHDPDSDTYNGDCIGCHGDRTTEIAMDGVTPAAHATMLAFFSGEGNARCTACHASGPDFLTLSAGGLREQVDMERANCAGCHGVVASTGAPTFYAD